MAASVNYYKLAIEGLQELRGVAMTWMANSRDWRPRLRLPWTRGRGRAGSAWIVTIFMWTICKEVLLLQKAKNRMEWRTIVIC